MRASEPRGDGGTDGRLAAAHQPDEHEMTGIAPQSAGS
jgi:hypothetical protein